MNLAEFNTNLINPDKIDKLFIDKIEPVLEAYPYFQAARILHLKGLQNQESFKFNDALKKTAAYTTDRSVLFDFICSSNQIVKANTKETISELPKTISEHHKNTPLETLSIGKPLVFNATETHSFNEWLQLKQLEPIHREETKPDEPNDLIENFIKTNPKIKPLKTIEKAPIFIESIQENPNIMTETLAKVYLEQKKYEKAIKAYQILILKYPEKSGFFADQIRAIKNLQKI